VSKAKTPNNTTARQRPRRAPDHIAKQEKADFATAVIAVYHDRIGGDPVDPLLASKMKERWPDVCRVAYGFAAIRQAIDQRYKEAAPEEMHEEGLREGSGIVDAVTSGRAHPVWDFLDGMRTGPHRDGRMPPNRMELLGQHWVLGIVRALEQVGCKHPKREVVRVCAKEGVTLDQQQIRNWERTIGRSDEPTGPDLIAIGILDHVQNKMNDQLSLTDRILKAVRLQIKMYLLQPEPKIGN
jgi:hypothetical protein